MQCSKCKDEAVIFQPYSGQYLCPVHLTRDIGTKVKRLIRQQHWMQSGDHIAVALTGTAADNVLLLFLQDLTGKRRDIRVSGIPVTGAIADITSAPCEAGITRIALSTTLETTSASLMADLMRGDMERCTGTGPIPAGPEIIAPFCHIPADEVAAYARICGVEGNLSVSPRHDDPLYTDVQSLLTAYSQRHPAAPHAILNLCAALRQTVRHDPGT